MTEVKIARKAIGEGEFVELAGGAIQVPSFTVPEKTYKVHPDSGYCSCPRFRFAGSCYKHVILGRAIQEARTKRSYGSFTGPFIDEDLFALCLRIFAKVQPNENPADSARLFYETCAHRYATLEMREAALARHNKVQAISERRAA